MQESWGHPLINGPLFSRVVGSIVTAPVGFSMFLGHRGIMPRLPISKMNGGRASLGCWLNTGGWVILGLPSHCLPLLILLPLRSLLSGLPLLPSWLLDP